MALALELGYVEDKTLQHVLLAVTAVTALTGLPAAAGLLPNRARDERGLDVVAKELAADVQRVISGRNRLQWADTALQGRLDFTGPSSWPGLAPQVR